MWTRLPDLAPADAGSPAGAGAAASVGCAGALPGQSKPAASALRRAWCAPQENGGGLVRPSVLAGASLPLGPEFTS